MIFKIRHVSERWDLHRFVSPTIRASRFQKTSPQSNFSGSNWTEQDFLGCEKFNRPRWKKHHFEGNKTGRTIHPNENYQLKKQLTKPTLQYDEILCQLFKHHFIFLELNLSVCLVEGWTGSKISVGISDNQVAWFMLVELRHIISSFSQRWSLER